MTLIVILAAVGVMFASLAGVLFTVGKAGSFVERRLTYLNTFAAGVFLIVSLNLLQEAFEFSKGSFIMVLIPALAGFLLFFVSEWFLPESHCHHDDTTCIHKEGDKRKAWKVLTSDAIHNTGDGILLVPVFLIDIHLGLISTIGIFIHEFLQEVAEFFVLRRAGYTTFEALQRNLFTASTILIGVILGFILTSAETLVAPLIAFAAGGFLHIVFIDLIPVTIHESRQRKEYITFIVAFLLGIATLFIVNEVSNIFLDSYSVSEQGLLGAGTLNYE